MELIESIVAERKMGNNEVEKAEYAIRTKKWESLKGFNIDDQFIRILNNERQKTSKRTNNIS